MEHPPPQTDLVVPARYPGLRRLAWNRDRDRPIPGAEALALYEAGWRHLDPAELDTDEHDLIEALARRFGNGHFLATR